MDLFKKILFITTFALFTNYSWGYPYYYFSKKKNNFSEREFRRYIRPQIRSIVQEYYFILKKMDPYPGNSINFQNKILQIVQRWDKGRTDCAKTNELTCQKVLKTLHKNLRSLDKSTFSLMNKKINLSKKKIEARLKMNDELGKILNLNYQILHILEENLIIYSQTYVPQKKWDKIDHHLQKILFHSGNLLTLFLDTKLKRNFEFLRINFIQNLEKKIIFEKDQDYILTRLGDLNIAWNSFHMRISKGDYKLDKGSKKILKNMHSRWNSILKIILAEPKPSTSKN